MNNLQNTKAIFFFFLNHKYLIFFGLKDYSTLKSYNQYH